MDRLVCGDRKRRRDLSGAIGWVRGSKGASRGLVGTNLVRFSVSGRCPGFDDDVAQPIDVIRREVRVTKTNVQLFPALGCGRSLEPGNEVGLLAFPEIVTNGLSRPSRISEDAPKDVVAQLERFSKRGMSSRQCGDEIRRGPGELCRGNPLDGVLGRFVAYPEAAHGRNQCPRACSTTSRYCPAISSSAGDVEDRLRSDECHRW